MNGPTILDELPAVMRGAPFPSKARPSAPGKAPPPRGRGWGGACAPLGARP